MLEDSEHRNNFKKIIPKRQGLALFDIETTKSHPALFPILSKNRVNAEFFLKIRMRQKVRRRPATNVKNAPFAVRNGNQRIGHQRALLCQKFFEKPCTSRNTRSFCGYVSHENIGIV